MLTEDPVGDLELTIEEALSLLDLMLLCPGDWTEAQRTAVQKLSEFCRQGMRDTEWESACR